MTLLKNAVLDLATLLLSFIVATMPLVVKSATAEGAHACEIQRTAAN